MFRHSTFHTIPVFSPSFFISPSNERVDYCVCFRVRGVGEEKVPGSAQIPSVVYYSFICTIFVLSLVAPLLGKRKLPLTPSTPTTTAMIEGVEETPLQPFGRTSRALKIILLQSIISIFGKVLWKYLFFFLVRENCDGKSYSYFNEVLHCRKRKSKKFRWPTPF